MGTVTFKCVAKRMSGGQGHEHITNLWWIKCVDGKDTVESGNSTREQMVEFIEKNGNTKVWCSDKNRNSTGHGFMFTATGGSNTFRPLQTVARATTCSRCRTDRPWIGTLPKKGNCHDR